MAPFAPLAPFALLCLSLSLLVLLTGCGPDAPVEPAGAPAEPAIAAPLTPTQQLGAVGDADLLAASAPFGLLRVAPLPARAGLALRHGRDSTAGPDLHLTLRTPQSSGTARWSASPGRLVGAQTESGTLVESTSSGRVALHRFSVFPGEPLVIDLAWMGNGSLQLTPARGRRAVTGTLTTGSGLELHAAVRFDTAFLTAEPGSAPGAVVLRFKPTDGVVQARIALSTVDLAGARANLEELEHWDFERAHAAVRADWDDWLGRLTVSGDTAAAHQLRMDWYRILSHFGSLADLDGRFRAGDGSVRRMPGGLMAIANLDAGPESPVLMSLLALLAPKVALSVAETLLLHQRVLGAFPGRTRWGFNAEPGANPSPYAVELLAGLVARNLEGLDAQRVFPPLLRAAQRARGEGANGVLPPRGYFAFDQVSGPSVSMSLESALLQRAVAVVAAEVGNLELASEFATRSLFYRQLFDQDSGWPRARDAARSWRTPFDPRQPSASVRSDYRDGEPWAGLWMAGRFDIEGLITLVGGRRELALRLDEYFGSAASRAASERGWPAVQHVPWLYAFSNRPDSAAGAVESWWGGAAGDTPSPGAAAWRIFAMLGFYPASVISGDYVLGRAPSLTAQLAMREGVLGIETRAPRAGGLPIELDGVPLTGPVVSHRRLAQGGRLWFSEGDRSAE